MKPVIFILPLLILMSGIATFLLVPLSWEVRVIILGSDVLVASLVAWILWRRSV